MRNSRLAFENSEFEEALITFAQALEFFHLGKDLRDLLELLGYHIDPQLPLFSLIEKLQNPTSVQVKEINLLFVHLKHTYPEVLQIVENFPRELSILIRENFLSLLNEIVDVRSLNQTVERLQNQVEPQLLNELYVLRNVYTALACDFDGFSSSASQTAHDIKECLYLFGQSRLVLFRVAESIGSIRNILDVYTGGVGRTSTVALVHTLLSTGEFSIALPGAVFTAVATFNGERENLECCRVRRYSVPTLSSWNSDNRRRWS